MKRRVLMISPGYPEEMQRFAAGLAEVGVGVIGLSDQPVESCPPALRSRLDDWVWVRDLWNEATTSDAVARHPVASRVDRVECLWEPGMTLAAAIRETLGLPGMSRERTIAFRDKEVMKRTLDAAGLRTPRHRRATTEEEVREAAEAIGYPLILKPIAGAGSADTYRIDDAAGLEDVIPRVRHVAELSVEEYIDGEEFTFDTVCVDGDIRYFNVSHYRPRPLIARTHQWISPQTLCLRRVDEPHLAPGIELGKATLEALGFESGFTHMEWFLTGDGEAVFGEIGARPPGARSVDIMNFASDVDLYVGWAEAVALGRFDREVRRRYNSAVIFKRAEGEGRIDRIEGLRRFMARHGEHVVHLELLPPGTPRRNWKATLISDGFCILRHPELQRTMELADTFGREVRMTART